MIEKVWTTKAGLRAVSLICESRGRLTHRCGYVEVPKGHPLFGVGYGDQHPAISQEMVDHTHVGKKSPILILTASVGADAEGQVRRSLDVAIDVHGGLTYSGNGKGKYPVDSEGWWFGFDCAHAGDGEIEPDLKYPRDGEVRSYQYVADECESVAAQICAMFPTQVTSPT